MCLGYETYFKVLVFYSFSQFTLYFLATGISTGKRWVNIKKAIKVTNTKEKNSQEELKAHPSDDMELERVNHAITKLASRCGRNTSPSCYFIHCYH